MRASLIFLSLAILTALAPAPLSRAAPYDHVRNGGFDDGVAGWTPAPSTSISPIAHEGGTRAMITAGGASARVHQRIDAALAPGAYELSLVARADTPADVTLRVESLADPSLHIAFSESIDAEWRAVGGPFTLAAAADARVVVEAASAAGVELFIDDARLEGPPPVPFTATPTAAPAITTTPPPAATATLTQLGFAPTSTAVPTATPLVDVVASTLRNGGFEDGAAGALPFAWETYGGALEASDDARSGERSARLESATASTKWLHQSVLVDGGAWYAFSAWVKHAGPAAAAAFLRVSWYASGDASGSALSSADSTLRIDETSPGWRLLDTGSIAAPPDARSARVRIMLAPQSAAPTSILVDDAAFVAAPPAPPPPGAAITPLAAGATTTAEAASERGRTTTGTLRSAPRDAGAAARAIAAGPALLVINEVLYDSGGEGADAAGEWVEIYNPGNAPVDIAGWSLADAATSDALPAVFIPARSFAIVAASASDSAAILDSDVPWIALDGRIGNGLGNDGDALYLSDKSGAVIDAVSWGDERAALDPPVADVPEGHSIERLTPGTDGDRATDWIDNAAPSPGRAHERTLAAAPRPGRRIEVNRAGSAFAWMPWAAVAMSAAALAATIAWRTVEDMRGHPPQP